MQKTMVRNGDVDGAIRDMRRKNAKEGLLKKARERIDGYEKPGVKRRKAKKEGIKNTKKRERNNR